VGRGLGGLGLVFVLGGGLGFGGVLWAWGCLFVGGIVGGWGWVFPFSFNLVEKRVGGKEGKMKKSSRGTSPSRR